MTDFLKKTTDYLAKRLPRFFIATGVALAISLFLSYQLYVKNAQRIDNTIFDFSRTVSWEKTKEGVSRLAAKGNIDTLILSKEAWNDFQISFEITNPRDCGFVFGYKDEKNYCLLVLNQKNQSVNLVMKKGGALYPLKQAPVSFDLSPSYTLTVRGATIHLAIDGKPVFQGDLSFSDGKIGLIIKDASEPRIYFKNIAINGQLADGSSVKPGNGEPLAAAKNLWPFFPLYILLMAAGIYGAALLSRLAKGFNPAKEGEDEKKGRINVWTAALIHLALTVIIFRPFVFQGSFLVSSTDNFGEILPLFLFSKHNFGAILSGASLCLWNPYNLLGMPFFANHWSMIYYPLNWPVFLFADKDVFSVLTLRVFIEVFLTGLCAYGFFVIELGSRRWALLSSIVYQLCSLLIFSLTVFPAISLYFSMPLYLYLLWSMSRRRVVWNYLFLTLAVVLLLTSSNVAFIFYAFISLSVISLYRVLSMERKERLKDFIVVALSVLTGLLIAAIRIIPCAIGIAQSNRITESFFTIHDRLFMLTRLFVPQIAGQFGFNALGSDNLNFVYKNASIAANEHNTFFVYFGILPALLLLLSIFTKTEGKHCFWKMYSLIVLASCLLFQPVWGIISILFSPFNHHMYQIIMLPVGICALVGFTGKYFEEKPLDLDVIKKHFFITLFLVQCLIIVIVTYLFPSLTAYSRILFIAFAGWFAAHSILKEYYPTAYDKFITATKALLGSLLLILIFFVSTFLLVKPVETKETVIPFFIVPVFLLLTITATAIYIFNNFVLSKNKGRGTFAVILLIPIIVFALLSSPVLTNILNLSGFERAYFVNVLGGQVIFFLILYIVVAGALWLREKALPRVFVVFMFIMVTALDLLVFNVQFDNVASPTPQRQPFYQNNYFYADINAEAKAKMDLINYRCDLLQNGGLNKNKNVIFRVPSYTGALGYMSKRFTRFISNFGYAKDTILIYPGDLPESDRFLDLAGVRYIFDNEGNVNERPSALPRLALFYSYKVIKNDEELLRNLKEPSFNYQEKILLPDEPREAFGTGKNRPFDFVPIENAASDEIKARVKIDQPALLLFNESYAEGWKAHVDGQEVPLYHANYNFMACPIAPGAHEVRFQFRPSLFFSSLRISCIGLALLILGTAVLFVNSKRK